VKLIQCILTDNDCFRIKRGIKPKGVMVHSTGADNPTLRRYVQPVKGGDGDYAALMAQLGRNKNGNHWNRPGLDVCVHGFIGQLADGSVASVQTLPWTHRGWHAGTGTSGGSANNTHISFEICEDGLADPAYFKLVYREAVELTAHLCQVCGLDPLADGVVICHSEGYRRGVASGHADVEHWFPRHGKSMDDFRADVAAELAPKPEPEPGPGPKPDPEEDDEMKYYKTLDEVPEYYRPTVEKLVEAGALRGTAEDVLNVSEEFCRTMTVLDRLGKLD
jgi:N-acetylmuramoyl-L-alanine amidase